MSGCDYQMLCILIYVCVYGSTVCGHRCASALSIIHLCRFEREGEGDQYAIA